MTYDKKELYKRRVWFRRVADRKFWLSVVRWLVFLNIVILFGQGIMYKSILDDNKRMGNTVSQQDLLIDQLLHEKMVLSQAMHDLNENTRIGLRSTAANSWQCAQLALYGFVDMSEFPKESGLKDPSSTWFDRWLRENNLIRE